MATGENQKPGSRATGRGKGKGTASKPQSAQARARAAKKSVTIDLEAKDVTPKPEAKTSVPKTRSTTKTTSEKSAPFKSAAKPEAAAATATNAKAETSQAKPAPTASKPTASSSKEVPNNSEAKNTNVGGTPPTKPPVQKTEKSGGSFFPNLVASIVGGVIAIGALIGLQKAEVIPSFGDGGVNALTSRVANLEDAPAVNAVSLDEFVSLSERLDEMEQGIENNDKNSVPEEVLARLTALEARLADAEGSVAPATTGDAALPSGITERLAAIEARLSASEGAGVDGQITALNEKLTNLDAEFTAVQAELKVANSANQPAGDVNTGSDGVTGSAGDDASSGLQSQLAALQKKVAALAIPVAGQGGNDAIVSAARQSIFSTIDPKFIALQGQLDETSSLLGAVQDKIASVDSAQSDIGGKLTALTEKLGSVEGALDTQNETTASVQLATKSLALENLKKIAQNGGAFGSALTSLERAGIEPEAIESLQPFSVTGLKDGASLKSELINLITLASAKDGVTGETLPELSAFEKLAKNAKSFIKIRSLSDDDTGPFNQLQKHFDESNVNGFLETWETLSEDQRQIFDEWLVEWKGNLALSSLIQKIEQDVAGNPADETSSQ
ncbi:MAG: hypothetical protein ABJO30_09130 [Hyphomicrobiales bacterium]